MTEKLSQWRKVAIEEYKTLREESLASMKMQQSILTLGTTTIGLLFSAAFNLWDKPMLPNLLFLVIMPLIVSLVMLMWAGEVARMFRASTFLRAVEKKINGSLRTNKQALAWETWLATPKSDGETAHRMLSPTYVAVWILFVLSFLISVIVGLIKMRDTAPVSHLVAISAVELIGMSIILNIAITMINKTRNPV